MKHLIISPLLCLVSLIFTLPAFAQTTAFTYQGRLNDGTNSAAGIYDLRFTIYGLESGGGVIAGPATNSGVALSNGLFTVTLDFGGGVFTGPERWLEIGVRTNGGGSFTPMTPRQPISSAPYAIRAGEAGSAATAGSAAVASSVAVNAVATSGLQNNAVNSDKIADGTIAADDLSAPLLSQTFWRLDGNAGTTPGSQFLGTTDSQAIEFKVNNDRALRLEPAPEVPNVIGGSRSNSVADGIRGATIAGGGLPSFPNHISGSFAAIGGGTFHEVSGAWGTIAGGRDNRVYSEAGTVAGGRGVIVRTNSNYSSIGGGYLNQISSNSFYTSIGGGFRNFVDTNSYGFVIAGGGDNRSDSRSWYSAIGGGFGNVISNDSPFSVVAGGNQNQILESSSYATISGGRDNRVLGDEATVSGGVLNEALAFSATIGGGGGNRAESQWSLVAAGRDNAISSNSLYSTIAGGRLNSISTNADYATVAGGLQNEANAPYSFAAGRRAFAEHPGAFVWADGIGSTFASTETNQFNVRASGGVRIQSNPGIQLNAADTPLITRGFDPFSTNAPVNKRGHGRWGLFMEPFQLTIGIPSNDIPDRYFQVAKYDTNGNHTSLMRVDQEGRVFANEFVGAGSGLSGVNADLLGGSLPSDFAQASHDHFGEIWGGTNSYGLMVNLSSTAFSSAALRGRHGAGAGIIFGIPIGVWGEAETGWGVFGATADSSGRGVVGWNRATAGTGSGVFGHSASSNGHGVYGDAVATNGINYGVLGASSSTSGRAVAGRAFASSGATRGVWGDVSSAEGFAGYFTGPAGSRNYFQQRVGIGTTTGTFQLELSQNSAAKPTSSSWTISSDARLKKNVATLEGSLEKLLQLRGVSYQWIDPASQGDMDGAYSGLIAQEVEQVFPEWIQTGDDGYMALTVIGFEALAVEALRELRAEKDAEIAELKETVNELKRTVALLLETIEAKGE